MIAASSSGEDAPPAGRRAGHVLDRPHRGVQPIRDLLVRQAHGRQFGDLAPARSAGQGHRTAGGRRTEAAALGRQLPGDRRGIPAAAAPDCAAVSSTATCAAASAAVHRSPPRRYSSTTSKSASPSPRFSESACAATALANGRSSSPVAPQARAATAAIRSPASHCAAACRQASSSGRLAALARHRRLSQDGVHRVGQRPAAAFAQPAASAKADCMNR